MHEILNKLRKLSKYKVNKGEYSGENVFKRKLPVALTDEEIAKILESVKCVRVIDGCLRIYGEDQILLITYRGTITEVKDYLEERCLLNNFFFHRSFILNLNVFDDAAFSDLSSKRMTVILQKWDLKLTFDLIRDLKKRIKINRKEQKIKELM